MSSYPSIHIHPSSIHPLTCPSIHPSNHHPSNHPPTLHTHPPSIHPLTHLSVLPCGHLHTCSSVPHPPLSAPTHVLCLLCVRRQGHHKCWDTFPGVVPPQGGCWGCTVRRPRTLESRLSSPVQLCGPELPRCTKQGQSYPQPCSRGLRGTQVNSSAGCVLRGPARTELPMRPRRTSCRLLMALTRRTEEKPAF